MIDLNGAFYNERMPKNLFKSPLEKVDKMRWLYKIAHDTADFRHGDEIKEINIFSVSFKVDSLVKSELVAIQKECPHPVLFTANDKWYIVIEGEVLASDKQFVIDKILQIEKRSSKLTELYEDIVTAFIPLERKTDESITGLAARYKSLQTLEREIAALQRKVDSEKQPNKRIEMNEELKRLRYEKEKNI